MKQNFQKNKLVTDKTLFFVIIPFCTSILFVLTLISKMAVLHKNIGFSIFVLSTKKLYSSFLKKVFIVQKICFKVKVLKSFEICSDCHIKNMLISQTVVYFENS